MKLKINLFIFYVVLFASFSLNAQIKPVTVEAESGVLGVDFKSVQELNISAITISSNLINSYNPGSLNRIATYQVTFPEAGTYDLYVRVLVGPNGYDDDSYFIGNGFGEKDPLQNSDWLMTNGLASGGYYLINSVVDGKGTTGSGIWKWINFSELLANPNPLTFMVSEGALTQTFQIGARENGLYIDKLVFGRSELYFTVDRLNKGERGLTKLPSDEPTATPLAEGQSKFLGCAWDYVQALEFPSYWNQSTPGNAGKWGSVESIKDIMNWDALDSTYNVAKRYNMLFKEHTLFWGAQQPAWINNLSKEEQRAEIEEWLDALSKRYPNIDYIDVVNEPIHNAPNGMVPWGTTVKNVNYADALGGAGTTGWDWIIEAFRLARQYFPNSKLIINEYNVINSETTTQQYIQIINLLKAENLIDGIGEQAHAFTTKDVSSALLKKNIDALAATGIPLYLTEVDIDGLTDLIQLKEMQRVFPIFWEHPSVKGVTLWGFRYGVWRNDQGAYLINEDGSERLAFKWLKAYVVDTLQNVESIVVSTESGNTVISQKGGTMQLKAEVLPANSTISNFTWSVNHTDVATIDQNGKLTALHDGTVTVSALAWDGSNVKGSIDISVIDQTVGISEFSANKIRIYPNPVQNGIFTISGIDGIQQIELSTLMGNTIKKYENLNQSTLIVSGDIPNGIYILFFSNRGKKTSQLIVIQ